jgi:hypothetical protein
MGVVPSVYSTGINDFYNPLTVGDIDFHYLVGPPQPIGQPQPYAYVADTTGTGWMVPTNNAQWVAADTSPFTPMPYVEYQTAFNLDRFDASTADVSGWWAASGPATIYLNGASTGITTSSSTKPSPFSLNGPFLPGINQLSFNVLSSGSSNGLLVSMTGTAEPLFVPEPSGLIAMGIALVITAFSRKIRRLA